MRLLYLFTMISCLQLTNCTTKRLAPEEYIKWYQKNEAQFTFAPKNANGVNYSLSYFPKEVIQAKERLMAGSAADKTNELVSFRLRIQLVNTGQKIIDYDKHSLLPASKRSSYVSNEMVHSFYLLRNNQEIPCEYVFSEFTLSQFSILDVEIDVDVKELIHADQLLFKDSLLSGENISFSLDKVIDIKKPRLKK